MGLHREATSQGLPLFHAELRRRLWWQVIILDSRSAQLSGAAVGVPPRMTSDTKGPLNVNDSDLNQAMKVLPVEPTGVTEMLFCSIRYELGHFMRMSQQSHPFDPDRFHGILSPSELDKAIAELQNRIEDKYLRFCDPSIPFHLLAIYMGRSAICQMRLMSHRPDSGDALPPERRENIFEACVQMLEYDHLAHSNKGLAGYLWHVDVFFPFHALIYVLGELNTGTIRGDLADRAWQLIDGLYSYHPTFLTDTKNALYVAIGSLVVKAWSKRQGERANRPAPSSPSTPPSIATLQSQRNWQMAQATQNQSNVETSVGHDDIAIRDYQSGQAYQGNQAQWPNPLMNQDQLMLQSYGTNDADVMDWEYWGALLQGQELPMYDGGGQPPFLNY